VLLVREGASVGTCSFASHVQRTKQGCKKLDGVLPMSSVCSFGGGSGRSDPAQEDPSPNPPGSIPRGTRESAEE